MPDSSSSSKKKSGKVEGKGGASEDIRLPGEKAVRETGESIPVKPEPRDGAPDHPTDPAAVDQRRQVIGTDDPKDKTE